MTELEALVERARTHRMTASELRQQRVSLIMGLRGRESGLTHKKVEGILEEVEGTETRAASETRSTSDASAPRATTAARDTRPD